MDRRLTYDLHDNAVIRDENVSGITDRSITHALIPDRLRVFATVLYYRPKLDANLAGVGRSNATD
eukprot:9071829-Pyramimonas_sp.AAC.1